jgi:hypothetical protein
MVTILPRRVLRSGQAEPSPVACSRAARIEGGQYPRAPGVSQRVTMGSFCEEASRLGLGPEHGRFVSAFRLTSDAIRNFALRPLPLLSHLRRISLVV